MIIDSQETFSTAQSVIKAAVGDIVSTNVLDTGAAHDVGIGERAYLYVKMNAALVGAGSSIQAVLQTATDEAFTSAIEVGVGPVTAVADAVANAELARIALPIGLKRYLRVVYRISGAATTAGTASAYIVKDVQAQQYGASGFSVE